MRIEGDGEEHDDQQRKEQHGDDGVEGAPLDAQVFDEMGPEGSGHFVWPSSEFGGGSFASSSPTHAPDHPADEDLSAGTPAWRMDGAPTSLVSVGLVRSAVWTSTSRACAARR